MISLALAMLLTPLPSTDLAPDKTQIAFEAQLNRWKEQEQAADRDIALVDRVTRAFFGEANASGPEHSIAITNASLKPLRDRLPDYRLTYAKAGDYCLVRRALMSARSSAGARKEAAVYGQMNVLAYRDAYLQFLVEDTMSEIDGHRLTPDKYGSALLNSSGEAIDQMDFAMDWSAMDYLTEPSECD